MGSHVEKLLPFTVSTLTAEPFQSPAVMVGAPAACAAGEACAASSPAEPSRAMAAPVRMVRLSVMATPPFRKKLAYVTLWYAEAGRVFGQIEPPALRTL